MAVLRIPEENRTISGKDAVEEYLGTIGIEYNVWKPSHPLAAGATQEEILGAYANEIEDLKSRGGYVTADVISVTSQTPNLDAKLNAAGVIAILEKPVDAHVIAECIESAIGKS